jgi:hypothetical protein
VAESAGDAAFGVGHWKWTMIAVAALAAVIHVAIAFAAH